MIQINSFDALLSFFGNINLRGLFDKYFRKIFLAKLIRSIGDTAHDDHRSLHDSVCRGLSGNTNVRSVRNGRLSRREITIY